MNQQETQVDGRVPVTERILNTITKIRDSGQTNMIDTSAVQSFANELECYSTVCWIQNNKGLYAQGILHGFKIKEVADE